MLEAVSLASGREQALALVPAAAGVGQIVGGRGQSLVIAPASNLRRWAATRLGAGPPPKPGVRPPVDLFTAWRPGEGGRALKWFATRLEDPLVGAALLS